MSVVEVARIHPGRETGDADDLSRQARARWKVLVDSRLDDHLTVLGAPGLPQIADPYVGADGQSSIALRCRERRARVSEESPFLWLVDVEYSTLTRDPARQDPNPLLRPAVFRWSSARFTRPFTVDKDGKPFVNSADVRLEHDTEDARLVLEVEKNKAAFDPAIAKAYMNATNSDVWLYNSAPGQFRCVKFDGDERWDGGVHHWKHSYAFEFRPEGWTLSVLDEGKAELVFDGVDSFFWEPIVSRDSGQAIADPVPLNGAGQDLTRSFADLTADMSADGTTIFIASVDLAANFPAAPFAVRVDDEIMLVTDKTERTVIRGYAGTTAATHTGGTRAYMTPYFLRFREFDSLPFAALGLP